MLKVVTVTILISLFLAACRPPEPASVQPQAAATLATLLPRSPWEGLVAAARKEGNLNIYAAELGAAKNAIRQAFREKYGIDVDSTEGRPAEILAKITAERRAGLYLQDIGLMGQSTFVYDIKPLGMSIPIVPLLILPEVTDATKWRDGKIPFGDKDQHSIAMVAQAIPVSIRNTDIIAEGEITSFADYFEHKWKGKIVLSDPAMAGSVNNTFALFATRTFGKERTVELMRRLAAQDLVMIRDSRLLLEWVARGKYPLGIGQSASIFAEFKRLGAPIAFVKLKEPPIVAAGAGNLFVFDKAPHPNATKLFVNWLLSQEGASVWSAAHGYPSRRLDVSTESFDPMLVPPPGSSIPDEAYLQIQGEMRKIATEIFTGLRK